MESIHFSSNDPPIIRIIPLELFPYLSSVGIDGRERSVIPMLNRLIHSVDNMITTLEVHVGTKNRHNWSLMPSHTRDKLFYRFLSSSPQLVHFKAAKVHLSGYALWNDGDEEQEEDKEDSEVWACRDLKTLSISLDNTLMMCHRRREGFLMESRHVFGYLSRVCPKLKDLSIELRCPVFSLESGLCLLTRLRDLQRLKVCSHHADTRDLNPIQPIDLYHGSKNVQSLLNPASLPPMPAPPPPPSPPLPRLLRPLLSRSQVRSRLLFLFPVPCPLGGKKIQRKLTCGDILICIDKI